MLCVCIYLNCEFIGKLVGGFNHLKNVSQIGNLSQVEVKIKNI